MNGADYLPANWRARMPSVAVTPTTSVTSESRVPPAGRQAHARSTLTTTVVSRCISPGSAVIGAVMVPAVAATWLASTCAATT